MEFIIEAAGIADGVAGFVATPERSRRGVTVGAHQGLTTGLMLVVGRAAIAGTGSTCAVAMAIAGAGTARRFVCRLSGSLFDRVAFQPGRTDGVARLEVEATSITDSFSIWGSSP